MVGEYGDVIFTLQLYLQYEVLHDSLSVEGDHSYMVEDIPSAVEHGYQRRFMETARGMVLGGVFI
jgi:hypothetical protein